jgi:TRAP-type mannitol/chloroaromatic compound transport system permease small subunit
MKKLYNTLHAINELTGKAIAWLTLMMMLVTFSVVLLRYMFDLGWVAMQESVVYMHATVFMLGAAYTMKHQGHVRVDIFYQRFTVKTRAWVDLIGTLLLLFPVSIFIAWMGWEYVVDAWRVHEGSREAGGLPGVFLLKSLIILMPTLLIVQGLAMLIEQILIITGNQSTEKQND